MLSRMLPTARRAVNSRAILAGRFPVANMQASAFHAGPVLRDEKAAAEPVEEKDGFLMDSLKDPLRAVPMGLLLAIPACELDVYMVNEETQLACCFMFFVGAVYTNFGQAIGDYLDERRYALLKEQNEAEDRRIDACKAKIEYYKSFLNTREVFESMVNKLESTVEGREEADQLRARHAFRNKIDAQLNRIARQESKIVTDAQTLLAQSATAHVSGKFLNDKKSTASAFNSALDALAGKAAGEDMVAKEFSAYLQTCEKENASTKAAKAEVAEMIKTMDWNKSV